MKFKIPFYVEKVDTKRSIKYFLVSWLVTVPLIIMPAFILIWMPGFIVALVRTVLQEIEDLSMWVSEFHKRKIFNPVDNFFISKLKEKRSKEELDKLVRKLRKKEK